MAALTSPASSSSSDREANRIVRAFPGEVDPGSPQEMRSLKDNLSEFRLR